MTSFFVTLNAIVDKVSFDLPPGPPFIKCAYAINLQKGGCPFFLFALMIYYWNFSRGAWIYFVLHGTYGWFWMLKHFTFPDASFERKMTLVSAVLLWVCILSPYLLPGYLMISGGADQYPSYEKCAFVLILYFFGVVLMLGADGQKYYTLRIK